MPHAPEGRSALARGRARLWARRQCDIAAVAAARRMDDAPLAPRAAARAGGAVYRAGGLHHALDYVAPRVRRARLLVTVHDLSFLAVPHHAEPSLAAYLATVVPRVVRRADRVLAVSAFTAQEVVERLHIPDERVSVVPNGVEGRFGPMRPASGQRRGRRWRRSSAVRAARTCSPSARWSREGTTRRSCAPTPGCVRRGCRTPSSSPGGRAGASAPSSIRCKTAARGGCPVRLTAGRTLARALQCGGRGRGARVVRGIRPLGAGRVGVRHARRRVGHPAAPRSRRGRRLVR